MTTTRNLYVVRKNWNDPASETIAKASNMNTAVNEAMTYLQESDRDYEGFDFVVVDRHGNVVEILDGVSWEPRG